MGQGLQKILKLYGRMTVGNEKEKVVHVYDYANNCPRLERDMTKEELAASEKAKWSKIKEYL